MGNPLSHRDVALTLLAVALIVASTYFITIILNKKDQALALQEVETVGVSQEEVEDSGRSIESQALKTYRNEEYDFELSYPAPYVVQENFPAGRTHGLFMVFYKEDQNPGTPPYMKAYIEDAHDDTFIEFFLRYHRLIEAEIQRYASNYFKQGLGGAEYKTEFKTIGGFDVLIHEQNFDGLVDGFTTMDVWLGNGKVLRIDGGSPSYHSLKKI